MNPKLPNLVLEHFSLPSVLFIYEKQLKISFQKKKKALILKPLHQGPKENGFEQQWVAQLHRRKRIF